MSVNTGGVDVDGPVHDLKAKVAAPYEKPQWAKGVHNGACMGLVEDMLGGVTEGPLRVDGNIGLALYDLRGEVPDGAIVPVG